MLISDLIKHLEDAMENHGDVEITLGYQPNYPLEAKIAGVIDTIFDTEADGECPNCGTEYADECDCPAPEVKVHLLAGDDIGYLPSGRKAWNNI